MFLITFWALYTFGLTSYKSDDLCIGTYLVKNHDFDFDNN